jgi:hypothetical protein
MPDQRTGVEQLPVAALYTLHQDIFADLYKRSQKARRLFSDLPVRLRLGPPRWPVAVSGDLPG